MTVRHDEVRLTLFGCSHKPKVSAMSSPAKGATFKCYICKRDRIVQGVVTTWARALSECQSCKWRYQNDGSLGKKRMIALAVRHANSRLHKVNVLHDGQLDVIKPQPSQQIPLIDDLLLP